jgi:hypothetical protein
MTTTWLDDIAADWANTPGVVDLIYQDSEAVTITGLKGNIDSQGPRYREIQGGVAGIEVTDTVWLVWAASFAVTPARGDQLIEEDDTAWTVLSVDAIRESEPGRSLVIKWRCVCRLVETNA